jgi:IMP cyclohydrolase
MKKIICTLFLLSGLVQAKEKNYLNCSYTTYEFDTDYVEMNVIDEVGFSKVIANGSKTISIKDELLSGDPNEHLYSRVNVSYSVHNLKYSMKPSIEHSSSLINTENSYNQTESAPFVYTVYPKNNDRIYMIFSCGILEKPLHDLI